MHKVKLLKKLNRYNVSGWDKHTLTGEEGAVVEVTHFNMVKLVEGGLVVEHIEEPETNSDDTDENTDPNAKTGTEGDKTGTDGSQGVDTDPPPPTGDGTTASATGAATFELTPEITIHIQKLTKDKIEILLRDYGVEVDKRKKLVDLQAEMIQTVKKSLPDDAIKDENPIAALVKYYADTFMIQLDAANYDEKTLTKLTEDVGTIIEAALAE